MVQRNHHTSALLQACRQVPNWAGWGGRSEPYAIEWYNAGSGNNYYTNVGFTQHLDNTSITMWLRVTDTIGVTAVRGVFGIATPVLDILSIQVEGHATGNKIRVYLLSGLIGEAPILSDWTNLTIKFEGGLTEMWVNGVLIQQTAATFVGPISGYTLGLTKPIAGQTNYLDNCILDEIALFSIPIDPLLIYNSGVPLDYGMNFIGLIASYEVEKATGSIRAQSIPARYYQTASPTPAPFNWQALGGNLNGVVRVTTNTLRSTDSNPLSRMADAYGKYGKGIGNALWSNRTPIGTGKNLEVDANGLMPYPAGGGFSTIGYSGALVGSKEAPEMTPKVSKAITVGSNGDSTAYANQGGTNSLSGKTDARAARLFAPLFVKKP